MATTAIGPNRTGAALVPEEVAKMLDAVNEFSPPKPINTLQMDRQRQEYIAEADGVGSMPPPPATSKAKGKRVAKRETIGVFLDKLGERLAFERTGTRLYDALITKCLALNNGQGEMRESVSRGNGTDTSAGADVLEKLREIRADELSHFHLLSNAVQALGGDPTAQTPSADVTAAASIGLMQVITDPRTTFAQCLNTILIAELADNAGWELLSELAMQAGQPAMAEQFTGALETETEHLETIRGWLAALLTKSAGASAVEEKGQ
jgi:hypothetical protein